MEVTKRCNFKRGSTQTTLSMSFNKTRQPCINVECHYLFVSFCSYFGFLCVCFSCWIGQRGMYIKMSVLWVAVVSTVYLSCRLTALLSILLAMLYTLPGYIQGFAFLSSFCKALSTDRFGQLDWIDRPDDLPVDRNVSLDHHRENSLSRFVKGGVL